MIDYSSHSVLFVDDERNLLVALRRLLADEPYEVRICENPLEALEEIRSDPPSAVVSDFYMPEMLGPQFLAKVREIDEGITRVILTGKPDVTAVLDAVTSGSVYRFILKPWDEDELRMTVRQAIGHQQLVAERNYLLEQIGQHKDSISQMESASGGIVLSKKRPS